MLTIITSKKWKALQADRDKMAQEIKHLTATIEQLDARIAADEVKQRLCRANLRDCFKRIARLVKEIKEVNKWQYTGK